MEAASPVGEVLKCTITLADVLVFVTGAPAVPPLGFLPRPSIQFWTSNKPDEKPKYPRANTCTNLFLPLQEVTLDTFKYNMLYGFCNSFGFGQV